MKRFEFFTINCIIMLLCGVQSIFPQNQKKITKQKQNLVKLADNPSNSVMDINNINTWVRDDGFHNWVVGPGSWDGSFPNGTSAGVIFSEGIIWGGKVEDTTSQIVRVDGNTYNSGCKAITRIYRVRPDYSTADLAGDAAGFFNKSIDVITSSDIQSIKNQYKIDWDEWPVDQGAPFKDVNKNGTYDPDIDIPGIPGASQTIFIKYNDDNSSSLYGSDSIGLEITETYWAYSAPGALGNVIYNKIDFVYKGTPTTPANSKIDSMYIVQWADPDVGTSTDDYAGCDTALNLGFAYNGEPSDNVFNGLGLAPPAIGYKILQSVSKYTGISSDSAVHNLKWQKGYKYVNQKPMSSFVYFAGGGAWSDPDFQTGALQFYNLMRGYLPRPPYPCSYAFPTSVADVTSYGTYLFDGDPVAGTGKIDGVVDAASDRRLMVTSGPFTLNIGDTAEVVIAKVGGLGNDFLNSVTKLKEASIVADTTFLAIVKNSTPDYITSVHSTKGSQSLPHKYVLNQNYPNPFNPATTIKYSVPFNSLVAIKVYDILGREVETLVNEEKAPGNYSVEFNASKLSSGVYFYRMQAGNFISTKKLILMK